MILVLFVSLFTTRVILQALGVVDYGIYNVVSGFVSMFAFLNTSMANSIQRFYNFSKGEKNDKGITDEFNTALQIQFLLALILFIILETVGLWYINNKMVIPADRYTSALWIFQFSIMSLVLVVMQSPFSAAIMANERMDFYAYISILEVLAKLGVAYAIMLCTSDKLIVYGALQLTVVVFTFLSYSIYSKIHFKDLHLKRMFNKSIFASMLSFFGWSTYGISAFMMKGQGLNMLLNAFFGPIVNAARGISYMIMTSLQSFQMNIVVAFQPQIVQSYAKRDYLRVQNLFFTLSKVSFLMVSILSIPIILELDYLLHLWLGEIVPEYTIPFTILVILDLIVSSLHTPISVVVSATGRISRFHIVTGTIIYMIVPVSYFFLRLGFNPNTVYVVSLAVTIVNLFICLFVLHGLFTFSLKKYAQTVMIPCLLFIVLSSIICSATMMLPSSFLRLVATGLYSIGVSCTLAYIIVLNNEEKIFARNYLNKIIKRKS